MSFENVGKMKTFLDKQNLRKLIASKSLLHAVVREVLQSEGNDPRYKPESVRKEKIAANGKSMVHIKGHFS